MDRIENPSANHSEAILELIAEVVGVLDLQEFRSGLLRALARAVPTDWISLNDLGPDPQSTVAMVEPSLPAAYHEIYARYAFENPLVARYQRTQDGRAYRFSDVATTAELHSTALYREFYAQIGLNHQLAFTLPNAPRAPQRLLAIALSRRELDFSDHERDFIDQARPFMIEMYRNAVDHTGLRTELDMRRRGPDLPLDDANLAAALAERGITRREGEVLRLVANGGSDRAVADQLGLSARTVQKHLQRCFEKLGVRTRADASRLAWSLASGRRRLR